MSARGLVAMVWLLACIACDAHAQSIDYTRAVMPMPDDLVPDELDASWYSENIAVGDLDGDGLKDVVVAIRTPIPEHQDTTPRIEVYRQLPGRSFEHIFSMTTPIFMHGTSYPRPMAACDLDKDGRDELILTQALDRKLQIFKLESNSLVKVGELTQPFELVDQLSCQDMDADGQPDLFELSAWPHGWGAYGTSVLKGLGGTSFAPAKLFPIHPYVSGVSLADGDGDGLPELAYAQIFSQAVVAYAKGIPVHFFDMPHPIKTDLIFSFNSFDPWYSSATFADLDNDGIKEFVVVHQERFVAGYLYDPSIVTGYRVDPKSDEAKVIYRYRVVMTNSNFVNLVFPRDFDGDGDDDLILSYGGAFDVVLNEGGKLVTQERIVIPATGDTEYSMVAIEDLDGDGCQDIAQVSWAAIVAFQTTCTGSQLRQAKK